MNFGVQNIVLRLVVIGQYFDIYIAILMRISLSIFLVVCKVQPQTNFVKQETKVKVLIHQSPQDFEVLEFLPKLSRYVHHLQDF